MKSWFENIFGFPECRDYQATREAFEYNASTGRLVCCKLDQTRYDFKAGIFTTPSLQELRNRVDLVTASEALGRRSLTVEEVIGDVSEFHADERNRFAMFQAASQFNALEHTSQHGLPEHGITCYSSDRTQGPACATACAPGTIVRNYFGLDGQGQSKDRQVRNLDDVEMLLDNANQKFFDVVSGYTLSSPDKVKRLGDYIAHDRAIGEEIKKLLKIGVQQDTEVVATAFGNRPCRGEPRTQLVTQAYCSAVSVSYSRVSASLWEPFARLILESAYESTLYAAVENFNLHPEEPGARKVFLTALGGGVFGNDMAWVGDAMRGAFTKFRDVGLEIYLVSYGGPTREFRQVVREPFESSASL
eukprot:CAMPEP_0115186382 /NCGR_PEP_ID=MMETSP0270-20121206/9952_1 /TAXON_ID=71861 /ORGANISM="Scrippsiella trochoidea, Strain CCMP3099" /LENGTH=359 /DNA_ID=CAMNT_0002599503 /DNA_START=69 /DNA_END=1148 /DNA_ORIENTATION=-